MRSEKSCGNPRCREYGADIHSHIIFRADDGAQTREEALELLQLDWKEGMRAVYATPHYGKENGYAPDAKEVRRKFEELSAEARKTLPGMRLYLGTEWYCSDEIVERIRRQEAWPMNDSGLYLVEFLEWGEVTESGDTMLRRLKKMKDAGIPAILAHPERYRAIQEDWDLAKRIRDLGVLLQVNAYDLCLNPKDSTRNLAQWMAKEKLISFLGSDMHGTRILENGKPARRPRMKEGIDWLYKNADAEYADEIVRTNAEKILGAEKLI